MVSDTRKCYNEQTGVSEVVRSLSCRARRIRFAHSCHFAGSDLASYAESS